MKTSGLTTYTARKKQHYTKILQYHNKALSLIHTFLATITADENCQIIII